ncbi:MAG TPA: hypothetical protein DEG90_08735 [Porphyromonadaceae bacterium]|nr:hypothetical protein [Porphyromonadaceae bacterium]
MKPARPLFIAFIISLMLWGGLAVYSFYKYDSNKVTPRTLAIESLKAVTENPDSLRLISVSDPIKVFGRVFITDEEMGEVQEHMMVFSDRLMQRTSSMTLEDYEDPEIRSLMSRQMSAISFLRSLNSRKDPGKEHSGWKVKIDFHSVSHVGIPYHAEYWAIMDKDCRYVLNSFEIPIL